MYIAAKGGEQAIEASRRLLAAARRGDPAVASLQDIQIEQQLSLLVSRVMAEASLYDPQLAAVAIGQAMGDTIEAVFLLRAYRTTLPRLGFAESLDWERLRAARRVSAIFKDLPGGQLLGPSFDYTQRLLELGPAHDDITFAKHPAAATSIPGTPVPAALTRLMDEGVVERCLPSEGDPEPTDITREPPRYPMPRCGWLQMMARADEGWLLGMAYSTQRGYAHSHPFAGEIRLGRVAVEVVPDELGFAIEIGEVEVTECQMLNQFVGDADTPPQFTRGYGLVLGHNERKAMAMALADRALRHFEFGESAHAPAQWQEFVLPHGDSVEASGFVQHLKLPHYVTFESELQMLRALRLDVEAS
jgi:alpha-D-ribose 1-methylphosphonate 5-triphosphate synthase subunit PhnI